MILENTSYKIDPGSIINIREYDTAYTEPGINKASGKSKLKSNRKDIAKIQDKFFACDRYSLLIVFQALDAAGKDSTVKHVFKKVRPQGIRFNDFLPPSDEEKRHDYLWRIHQSVPQRRMISIFHRSYYEDVTATRVHPEYILEQKIPGIEKPDDIDEKFWMKRYEQINNFEKYLVENGIHILKFFLNVSEAKQSKRFLKRLRRKDKHWKFSGKDIKEQTLRQEYLDAYEKAINNTSTPQAPWYIIPADHKWFMRWIVSEMVLKKMKTLDLEYPDLKPAEQNNIEDLKKKLKEKINQ